MVRCKQCGSEMEQTHKVDRNIAVQLLGVLVFIIGVALLPLFPIGTILGFSLILFSLKMGYKKKRILECPSCGYSFERE